MRSVVGSCGGRAKVERTTAYASPAEAAAMPTNKSVRLSDQPRFAGAGVPFAPPASGPGEAFEEFACVSRLEPYSIASLFAFGQLRSCDASQYIPNLGRQERALQDAVRARRERGPDERRLLERRNHEQRRVREPRSQRGDGGRATLGRQPAVDDRRVGQRLFQSGEGLCQIRGFGNHRMPGAGGEARQYLALERRV